MIKKLLILLLVLGMSSSAGAALSLVPEELTLSGAGDTGTIQVVSNTDGGYGCWIELVDLSIADYDGDPEVIPICPLCVIPLNPDYPNLYGEIIVMSLDPANPILPGAHINVNLVGIAEGVTTLNLYASDGVTLLDSSTITVLPEPECFPPAHPDYSEWVNVGKPDCWCYPRQCHGDADGLMGGSSKCGYYDVGPDDLDILISSWLGLDIEPACGFYYVGPGDLNILISAWLLKEPPLGPGIASIPDGICADFAHDLGGNPKTGFYRVGPTDLNILVTNWLINEPPGGPGVPPNCLYVP